MTHRITIDVMLYWSDVTWQGNIYVITDWITLISYYSTNKQQHCCMGFFSFGVKLRFY